MYSACGWGAHEPSCVVVSEYNVDEWLNAGLMPVPGKPDIFAYGFIPPGHFAKIKAKLAKLAREKKRRVKP
jgi:hypothetical protein